MSDIEKAISEFKINLSLSKEELDLPLPEGEEEHIKEWITYQGLAISALEKQLNNGWIPCKDRLPEETGRYIVTYHEWSDGNYLPKYDDIYVKVWRYRKEEQYTGFVYPTGCNIEAEQDTHREVIAWQPLPEPYKEEL
jgi:hypothetical protein